MREVSSGSRQEVEEQTRETMTKKFLLRHNKELKVESLLGQSSLMSRQ